MRVMIVSDTHGRHGNFDAALSEVGKIDMILHLGDVERGESYIEAVAPCPVVFVSGNNDFYSFLKKEQELNLCGKHIFMTHGHYYFVSIGTEELKEEGKRRGADIVMYGHTHMPYLEEVDGMTILNPGSLSFPRQRGRKPSYMLMEIDPNGQTHFEIRYIESGL